MNITSRALALMIDHTLLKPEATEKDVLRLCREALEYSFGAVCVNPARVAAAAEALAGSQVSVCAVAGFPLGAATAEVKAAEAAMSVRDGAGEIDMVINIGLLKDGRYNLVLEEVRTVVHAVSSYGKAVTVKTIIETCFLTNEEKVAACRLCERAGARYIKTSTGFGPSGATVEDVKLLSQTVSPQTGVKASGGIKTLDQALAMVRAGASRIGTSSGIQILREMQANW